MPIIAIPKTANLFSISYTISYPSLSQPIQTTWELGRELIFAIHAKNFAKVRSLLLAGADLNYRDPHTGDTPLHYLFLYNCNPELAELLLNAGADPRSINAHGVTSYLLAKERCSAKDWQALKPIFDTFLATPFAWVKPQATTLPKLTLSSFAASSSIVNVTATYHETTSVAPKQSYETLGMLLLPVSSLVNGSLSVGIDTMGKWSEQHAHYLPGVIHYGLKPMALAAISASMNSIFLGSASSIGLEEAGIGASFFSYAILNYFGLLIAQPIERALAKKIQNKAFNILFPILLYSAFLNPSLFFTEGFWLQIIPRVIVPLMNGLLFKAGEWGTQKAINSSFFKKADTEADHHLLNVVTYANRSSSVDVRRRRETAQLLPINFEQDIVNFRWHIVRKDIAELNSRLHQLAKSEQPEGLKSLNKSLNACEDLASIKTNLSDLLESNQDNYDLKKIMLPFFNYITALDKDWDSLCAPDFLTKCLRLAAENEHSRHVNGHLLLSTSTLYTLRFEFLKLEMFNFYLEANQNPNRNTFFSLVGNETQETLSIAFCTALQAIKTILFDEKLTRMASQVFTDVSPDLKENCDGLAAYFSVVIKQFETLRRIFYAVDAANPRVMFLSVLDSSSRLCKQRVDFVTSILNQLDSKSKGRQQGIIQALGVFQAIEADKTNAAASSQENARDVMLRKKS